MDEKITLKKVNIIGKVFFHVFENENGDRIEEQTDEEDYIQLSQKNPINPQKDGYVWSYSYSDFKYDTPSGRVEDGCYAENGDKYRIVIDGIEELCLPKEDIENDKILKSKVDSMVESVYGKIK